MSDYEASRRNVIYGIAAAGVAAPILAACGSDSGDGDGNDATGTSPSDTATTGSTDSGGSSGGGIKTSDIPVGGGEIIKDQKIVVTQPTAGEFKAFTAVCTHQGCLVSKIEGDTINCTCHGSQYSIEDGSVVGGPAPSPLAEKTVTVSGDTLTVS